MTDNQALLAIVAALGIGYFFGKRMAGACACQGQLTEQDKANMREVIMEDVSSDPMGWLTGWTR